MSGKGIRDVFCGGGEEVSGKVKVMTVGGMGRGKVGGASRCGAEAKENPG